MSDMICIEKFRDWMLSLPAKKLTVFNNDGVAKRIFFIGSRPLNARSDGHRYVSLCEMFSDIFKGRLKFKCI